MDIKRCALLLCTCDAYEDLWDPFFQLVNIYWKDIPYNIYINTENKKSYLMCTKCHQLVPIEVDKKVLEEETKKILQKHKFTVHRHSLIFFGHCNKCQQNHL